MDFKTVFVLMVLLPPLMAWRGRYHLGYAINCYTVPGGKLLLAAMLVCGVILIALGLNAVYSAISIKLSFIPSAIFAILMLFAKYGQEPTSDLRVQI